jgi:hypothetical protein
VKGIGFDARFKTGGSLSLTGAGFDSKFPASSDGLSDLWVSFSNTETPLDFTDLASKRTLHTLQGNWTVAMLIKGGGSNGLSTLLYEARGSVSEVDFTPSIRFLHDNVDATKPRFLHLRANGGIVGDLTDTSTAFDDNVTLLIIQSQDNGTDGLARMQVNDNAPTTTAADARQGDGEPWNSTGPVEVMVGRQWTGYLGWIGFLSSPVASVGSQAACAINYESDTGGDQLWAAYQSGGRRALSEKFREIAFNTEAGRDAAMAYAQVTDGVTPPDYNPYLANIDYSALTFESIEV